MFLKALEVTMSHLSSPVLASALGCTDKVVPVIESCICVPGPPAAPISTPHVSELVWLW